MRKTIEVRKMDNIITIGRQYGSGGREIGRKVAEALNIPFYDKDLIALAAKQSGISEDLFYQNDETQPGSFIYSLVMGTYPLVEGNTIYPNLPMNHKVFLAQFDAIKEIAKQGPCVIVGRCADYVLHENKNVVNVFISADNDFRIKRISETEGNNVKKVEDYIKKVDKKRSNHYKYYTNRKWGDATNYDLCINSSKLGVDKTAEMIINYVNIKEVK